MFSLCCITIDDGVCICTCVIYSVGRHDSHPGGHQEVAADEKWVSVSKQSGKEPGSHLCCSSPTGFPGGAHFPWSPEEKTQKRDIY